MLLLRLLYQEQVERKSNMTKFDLLVEYREMEKYLLACFAADRELTRPKPGMSAQFEEHQTKIRLLSDMIGDYEAREEEA